MRIYLIAGEASGDMYGGHIIEHLLSSDPHNEVRFWGGDQMLAQSPNIVKHINETAIMGFFEVVKNLKTIKANLNLCKSDILEFEPDCIIFIDYPGFNLRIAEWAKSQDITTAYYIAPKVWAWKESRVKKLKAYVDYLYVIFPFEVEYFAKHGISASYFGSPLVNQINDFREANPTSKDKIILMPGSRKQELQRHLPIMIDFATIHNDQTFILPMAQGVTKQSLEALSPKPLTSNIELVDDSWTALNQAKLGIITSGTATLEAMLFDVPQVVIYKTSWVTYKIAQLLIKIKWASLVNIIANKEVVRELLQYEATMENLEKSLEELVQNSDKVEAQYKAITASLHTTDKPIHEMVDDLVSKLNC